MVDPVTDESTGTGGVGVGEDYIDSATATTSIATVAATMSTTDMVTLVDVGDSTDNEERKLSSGCESDMTTTSTGTTDLTASPTNGKTEITDVHQENANEVTEHVTLAPLAVPHPIGAMEENTAKMIRNIAISIANEKLQLPTPASTAAADVSTKRISTATTSDWGENQASGMPQNEIASEKSKPLLSELVELGIMTCTKEIVISAIESLLYDQSHSNEVYRQNLQELSTSSLPNLVPICKHIFESNQYRSIATISTDVDTVDCRPSTVPSSVIPSVFSAKTVTPETTATNGVSTVASSSSLIRVITTGSDGERTMNDHQRQINNDGDQKNEVNPRNLNIDSNSEVSLSQLSPKDLLLSTRIVTRRLSAKGNSGITDFN